MIRSLGTYAPNRPRRLNASLLAMLFNGLHDRHSGRVFVIEVGAGVGLGQHDLLARFRENGWSGLLIEPHPDFFAALETLHAHSDRVAVLNLGISDQPGNLPLFSLSSVAAERHPDLRLNRASLSRDRVLAPGLDETDIRIAEVPFLRLDTVLAELGIESAQLLVVNAGGHEPEVLSSLDLVTFAPSLVLVRTPQGSTTEATCLARLTDAGLLPFRLSHWLVGLRPGALAVPLEELLTFLQRGVGEPQEDTE